MQPTTTLSQAGRLGMRWGVITEKRSSGKPRSSPKPVIAAKPVSSDHKTVSEIKKKKVYELSNDDIRALANRVQLEKQYRDLTKTRLDRGKDVVTDIMKTVAKQVVATVVVPTVTELVKQLLVGKTPAK